MTDPTEREFNRALFDRMRKLREGLGWSQTDMAKALGVPPANYQKYETRTPLPHFLLERFALIVRRDLAYVLTGRAARQAVAPESIAERRRVVG
jgi:transcriptional regulator with XRE-family HTH domain